jgi:Hemerythrin HHE cation binding domain
MPGAFRSGNRVPDPDQGYNSAKVREEARMGEQPVDAVDVLTAQHTHIAALFEAAAGATGADRAAAFTELVRLIAIHETVEAQVIHPLARHTIDDGEAIIDARLAEEALIKVALGEIDALGSDDPAFGARLSGVRRVVLAHNAAEEADEFGPLRSAVPIDILREQVLFIRRAEVATPSVTGTPEPPTPDPADVIFERVRDVLRPR